MRWLEEQPVQFLEKNVMGKGKRRTKAYQL